MSVVLRMLASGNALEQILEAYPELEEEDVRQALQYAAWLASDRLYLSRTGLTVLKAMPGGRVVENRGVVRCRGGGSTSGP